MLTKLFQCSAALLIVLMPARALALQNRTWAVNTGGGRPTVETFFSNLIAYSAYLIGFVTATLFLIGALMVVLSRGKPDQMENGKKLMINSLIGMMIVLGAYGILRTVTYIVTYSA
jgi:Type IV secretion system pilin